MLFRIKLLDIIDWLLIAYIFALIYLYPFGVPLIGSNNLRVSDIIALPLLFFCILFINATRKLKNYPILNSIVFLFILFELIYPILGLFIGYEGLGAIANSLRMALIWLPLYLYILLSEPSKADTLDIKFNKILKYSVILNIIYGLIQIAVKIRFLPSQFLITRIFEPFAVDSHFRVSDGIRASGFFVNTTGLSVFAILSMSYFFARYIGKQNKNDFLFSILSFFAVVLTTSRAAVFTGLLILFIGWFFLNYKDKLLSIIGFISILIIGYFLIEAYIGTDIIFGRFYRLAEGGASTDRSFSARSDQIWPRVFQQLEAFEYGTFVNAVSKVGLVDSGYLTYYAQGKWPFLIVLVIFLLVIFLNSLNIFLKPKNWANFLVLSISLYLIFTMVVLNPIRSPFVIFFLLFGLWQSESYKLQNEKN